MIKKKSGKTGPTNLRIRNPKANKLIKPRRKIFSFKIKSIFDIKQYLKLITIKLHSVRLTRPPKKSVV